MIGFVSSFAPGLKNDVASVAVSRPSARAANTISMRASEAIPFLEAPESLPEGLPGGKGFDPLLLSDHINLHHARCSEIKHGRISMLATLGYVVQEIVQLPGAMHAEKNALAAIYKAPIEGWWQIIFAICIVELVTFKANYDESVTPGFLGFDPLGLGAKNFVEMQNKEIQNGRLAMMGISGFIMQSLVTGQGVVEQLTHFKSIV